MYIDNILVQSNVFSNNTKLDEFVETLLGVVNTPTVDSNIRCIGRLMGGRRRTASGKGREGTEERAGVDFVRVGVGFTTDGKGGCGFRTRQEEWVWVLYENGRVGVGFIKDGKGGFHKRREGCGGFDKRSEGWV